MRLKPFLQVLVLLALITQHAGAQGPETMPALDSRSFPRDFAGRSVLTEITLRAGGSFETGHRAYLQIDLDSRIDDALPDELARAVVVNGYVVIALPPGLEPDGEPRLMYYDSAKARYEFMYSKAYPNLTRLDGLAGAMADAASNEPARILSGLDAISRALDPAISTSGPSDARLTGGSPKHAVTGISWLIPCNVWFNTLVNLFDPEDSVEQNARLRVSLPLKVTGVISDPQVAVFAGGLSAALAKVDLLPADIPPTAMPLAPLPEAASPAQPAEQTPGAEPGSSPGASQPGAAKTGGKQEEPRGDSSSDGVPPRRIRQINSDQDEAPAQSPPAEPKPDAVAADSQSPPAPPTPIPVLTYSYQWVTWETDLDLSMAITGKLPLNAGLPSLNPVDLLPPTVEPAGSSNESAESEQAPSESIDIAPPLTPPAEESEPPATPPTEAAQALKEPAPLRPAGRTESKPQAEKPAEQAPGVREVQPGTLPDEPQTFTVPLKPITGSGVAAEPSASGKPDGVPEFHGEREPGADGSAPADGMQPGAVSGTSGEALPSSITSELPPDSATVYPAAEGLGEMVLIPEGYFLMGTGGNSSAGDADELPQTQVYLPAYYIDKYPVTNRQFMEFVLRAGYKTEGGWDQYYSPGTADLPVRGVSWNDAMAYAAWAGKRLPTEAEWEKAARGADGRTYPWGEEWSADILPRGDVLYEIMTASQCASPFGVMGTCGLVWQWTASAYADYPFNPDARGDKRVLRGGCFSNGRNVVRCANRYAEAPQAALNTFSLRCVKDAK